MHKPDTILRQIAHQHGITILAQSRLKGLILDMMPTAERKHINVLKRAIDEQIGGKLLDIQHDDPSVRQIKINTLKEKFKIANAFDDTAYYIVDCFLYALGWNTPEPQIVLPFKEIKIGNQIWADRNLDVNHFCNGDPIPEARTNEEWKKAGDNKQPARCYYDNDYENGKTYAKLYNWFVVNDPRGLTPEGWHVPTDEEWEELIEYLGEENNAGLKLKRNTESMKKGVDNYEISFNALSCGSRNYYGVFSDLGKFCSWWSITEHNSRGARNCLLSYIDGFIIKGISNKVNGYSIRCLKN